MKEEIFKTEGIGLCVANILVCVPYVRVNYLTFVECLNLHLYRCQVKYVVCTLHAFSLPIFYIGFCPCKASSSVSVIRLVDFQKPFTTLIFSILYFLPIFIAKVHDTQSRTDFSLILCQHF